MTPPEQIATIASIIVEVAVAPPLAPPILSFNVRTLFPRTVNRERPSRCVTSFVDQNA
jgi:hypothetical protein